MARRRKPRLHEETDQHERWMVSYADFITLLFAFFVVMYSISSVNKSKYQALTDSIEEAFTSTSKKNNSPISALAVPAPYVQQMNSLSVEIVKERQLLSDVSRQFQAELAPFIDQKLVDVKQHDFWIELEMNSELLFLSGESEVSERALFILKKVAKVVRWLPNMINVEGYSDDVPISTVKFSSNWDLASARATSVVRALIKENVSPVRLAAVGYGEFHPIADNTTEAGRFKNRRVVLLLMSQVFSRYGADDKERARLLNLGSSPHPVPK
jgi:chemotaxis protein MotB